MSKLDRLISHTKTKAMKSIAGKRLKAHLRGKEKRLSKADNNLIESAAMLALNKEARGKKVEYKPRVLPKGLKCIAWINARKIEQCLKKSVDGTGYCEEHKPGE